ncbi:glycosyltransferase family 4 protein [Zhouia sp. PK063]|uniref:glycosyltransferase family 4 protein n=1 Tax=Zhouia sp. PK063 TaxID=3373602 RepID=UPI003794142C
MTFAIITHVPHIKHKNQFYGYAPYVREMNIWLKHVDEVCIVAPLGKEHIITAIDLPYEQQHIQFKSVPAFSLISISEVLKTFLRLPLLLFTIWRAMKKADHIHLRCPGNMGLLGCIVQLFFPKKMKTAKYAGNWDPKSKQPWTYTLQKWILSTPFLTKNMQVLVYGEWPQQTKNIKPFFTASFHEHEIPPYLKKSLSETIHFSFIGTFSPGKRPLYAVKLVAELYKKGLPVHLHMYGDGVLFEEVKHFIVENQLEKVVFLYGNQPKEVIQQHLNESHFLLLPSKSEGWPKVVAEAMCYSSLPLVTPISCVPYMLNNGERGVLLSLTIAQDVNAILNLVHSEERYHHKVKQGYVWSKNYTLELFEEKIKGLLG